MFERIRQRMEAIALVRPDISFSLRNDVTGNVVVQTHKVSSILSTFSALFGKGKSRCMKWMENEKDQFRIEAYVSTDTSSRKDHQFVYVNKRLVLKTKLHKSMNYLLGRFLLLKSRGGQSSSGTDKSESPSKQADRYAMFIVCVTCPFNEYDITFEPAKTLIEFKSWRMLRDCMEEMVTSFLKKENLLPLGHYVELNSEENSQDGAQGEGNVEMEEAEDNTTEGQNGCRGLEQDRKVNCSENKSYGINISTSQIQSSMSSKCVTRVKNPVQENKIQNGKLSCEEDENAQSSKTDSETDSVSHTEEESLLSKSGKSSVSAEDSETASLEFCPETPVENGSETDNSFVEDKQTTNFKTPQKCIISTRKCPPRLKHCDKVRGTPLSDSGQGSEYESEDPLSGKSPSASGSNLIRIPTPHLSALGGSSLSVFKENFQPKQSAKKNLGEMKEVLHGPKRQPVQKTGDQRVTEGYTDGRSYVEISREQTTNNRKGIFENNFTGTVSNSKTSNGSLTEVASICEKPPIACNIDSEGHVSRRRPSQETMTTASKVAKLMKDRNDAYVLGRPISDSDASRWCNIPVHLDEDDMTLRRESNDNRTSSKIVIPPSLRLGFQVKKHASFPDDFHGRESKPLQHQHEESVSDLYGNNFSDDRPTLVNCNVVTNNQNHRYLTSESLIHAKQTLKFQNDMKSDEAQDVIVDMNDVYESSTFRGQGQSRNFIDFGSDKHKGMNSESSSASYWKTNEELSDKMNLACDEVVEFDDEALSPNDLICYESFDTSVLAAETSVFPMTKHARRSIMNYQMEKTKIQGDLESSTEEFCVSSQGFQTSMNEREKLKLSLTTNFPDTESKFGSSLGFIAAVSPDSNKSNEGIPIKEWNSTLSVPQFEQRGANSPGGSEGFTPLMEDLDLESQELSQMDTCDKILINDAISSGTDNQLVTQGNDSATEKDFSSDEYMDDLSPGSLSIARFLGEDSDYKRREISGNESMVNLSLEKWFSSSQSGVLSQQNSPLSKHQCTAASKDNAEEVKAAKDLSPMQNMEQLKAAEEGTLHMDEKGAASVVYSQTHDVVPAGASTELQEDVLPGCTSTGLREEADCSQWSDAAEEDMVNVVDRLLQSEAVGGENSGKRGSVSKAGYVCAADVKLQHHVTRGSLEEKGDISNFHEEPGEDQDEEIDDGPAPGTSAETWVKVNSSKSGTVNLYQFLCGT